MKIQKENITLCFEGNYNKLLNDFLNKLYSKYIDVSNKLNITGTTINIELMSKGNLDKYVLLNSSYTLVPSWLVGFTSKESIHVLYPSKDNLNYIVQVTLHEIIHLMLYSLDVKSTPLKVLDEGIATYFSNQMSNEKFDKIVEDYTNNNLLKISDLLTYDSSEFAKIKGYSYSFFLIKFLYNNISLDKILEYFCKPNLFIADVNIYENDFEKYLTNTIINYLH